MPTYRYEARGTGGKSTSGVVSAPTLAAASEQLRAKGEYIIHLAPAVEQGVKGKGGLASLNYSFGPSARDVVNFTGQLAVMIRAGISIRAAIGGIADQVENPKFKKMLQQMRR